MIILKRVLISVGALVAIVLLAAVFVNKDYTVEKEIVINKPKQLVFDYIKHLKNQDHYSTFAMKDRGMRKTFKGTDATVGFIYAWEGDANAGKGEQEIKKITEGERMDLELRFVKPIPGMADAYMTTEAIAENKTKVKWGFKSRIPYPFNVIRIFMSVEDLMGKELDTSLKNMKANLEK